MVSFRWYEILTYLKKHIFRKVPLSEIIGTAIGCFFGLGLVSYITMGEADYSFVFTPILFGALILVCIAVIVNQFVPGREYPTHRKK